MTTTGPAETRFSPQTLSDRLRPPRARVDASRSANIGQVAVQPGPGVTFLVMVEVLQPNENFDYGETDCPKMSSGDVFFVPINYEDKGGPDPAGAAESHLDPATSRSCSHGNSWMFPGINAILGGQESRDKDTLVNTQHVLASDNGASAAPHI